MKAEIWNYKGWVKVVDNEGLYKTLDELLVACSFNVLGFIEHKFKPQGYTALWLLGESHFAIHTFPEHGKTYWELSSCNEEKGVLFNNIISSNDCFSN